MALTESLVAHLFPKIGVRARFLARLNDLKKSVEHNEVGCDNFDTPKSARILHKEKLDTITLSCFYCQTSFSGWSKLVTHFRHTHSLTMLSNFVCGQLGCQRDFQSLKSFRRHILVVHADSVDSSVDSGMEKSYGGFQPELHMDTVDSELYSDRDDDKVDDVNVESMFDEHGVNLAAAAFVAKLTLPFQVLLAHQVKETCRFCCDHSDFYCRK